MGFKKEKRDFQPESKVPNKIKNGSCLLFIKYFNYYDFFSVQPPADGEGS